jgi:hypothetical protein
MWYTAPDESEWSIKTTLGDNLIKFHSENDYNYCYKIFYKGICITYLDFNYKIYNLIYES